VATRSGITLFNPHSTIPGVLKLIVIIQIQFEVHVLELRVPKYIHKDSAREPEISSISQEARLLLLFLAYYRIDWCN
jgi:hypothetical protein